MDKDKLDALIEQELKAYEASPEEVADIVKRRQADIESSTRRDPYSDSGWSASYTVENPYSEKDNFVVKGKAMPPSGGEEVARPRKGIEEWPEPKYDVTKVLDLPAPKWFQEKIKSKLASSGELGEGGQYYDLVGKGRRKYYRPKTIGDWMMKYYVDVAPGWDRSGGGGDYNLGEPGAIQRGDKFYTQDSIDFPGATKDSYADYSDTFVGADYKGKPRVRQTSDWGPGQKQKLWRALMYKYMPRGTGGLAGPGIRKENQAMDMDMILEQEELNRLLQPLKDRADDKAARYMAGQLGKDPKYRSGRIVPGTKGGEEDIRARLENLKDIENAMQTLGSERPEDIPKDLLISAATELAGMGVGGLATRGLMQNK